MNLWHKDILNKINDLENQVISYNVNAKTTSNSNFERNIYPKNYMDYSQKLSRLPYSNRIQKKPSIDETI